MYAKLWAMAKKKVVDVWRQQGYDSSYEHTVHKNISKLHYHKEGLLLDYTVDYTYEPDFYWPTSNEGDKPLLVETKGDLKRWDRKKFLCMFNQNRDRYAIKLLFPRETRLPGCSKLTNVQWAKHHGIDCAVGKTVPKEWLGE